jgi:hypothetical protein
VLPVPLVQQLDQLAIHVGGVGLVTGHYLELSAPQAGGDLQRSEMWQALLGVAQRVGQAGLR